jgi:hypothetical protein
MAILKYFPRKIKIKDNRNPDGGYFEAQCDVCGTTYYPKRNSSKYCSNVCAQRAHRKRTEEEVKQKTEKAKKPKEGKPVAKKTEAVTSKIMTPEQFKEKNGFKFVRTYKQWSEVIDHWEQYGKIDKTTASQYHSELAKIQQKGKITIGNITVVYYDGYLYN